MKIFKLLLLFIFISATASAQNFIRPTEGLFSKTKGFSKIKDTFITFKDGEELTCKYRKTKRKKGLFLSITVENSEGKEITYPADKIKHMYLPASDFGTLGKGLDQYYDVTDWDDDSSLNQEYLKDGYAYFESVTTIVKKKTVVTLLQILNPAYCQKVRVYNNPWAGETSSLNVGGFKVAGGDTKSYYVKAAGQDKAFLLMKKNYKKEFKTLYGDCKKFMQRYKSMKWADIEEHVYEHAKACSKA